MTWRLVLGTGSDSDDAAPADGALNMAVDEMLFESVQRGGRPVLRFYSWNPPCLSFGRNQRARDVYDAARAAAAGVDIVRRPTGGLAVLHDRELTYCVVAPLESFGGPRAAYAGINRALVEGLSRFGIPAEQATGVRVRGPLADDPQPCFQAPAAGEVVALGRKLVGSAQRCARGVLLQHGSILLSGSQARVQEFLAHGAPVRPAHEGSVTLHELLGCEPSVRELVDAMRSGFEHMFGTRLAPERLVHEERARSEQLAERYRAGDWTWRR